MQLASTDTGEALFSASMAKGYDNMGSFNMSVVASLRRKNVPESFIEGYLKEIPLECNDLDKIAKYWSAYTQPLTESLAHYLKNTRTEVAWLYEFSVNVPELIIKQH